MTTTPLPDDPVWESIRTRYEQSSETVHDIAATVGLSRLALSLLALKRGWKLRGKTRAKTKVNAKVRAMVGAKQSTLKNKTETTRETISRLKDMLQQRVATLEKELQDLGTEVSALNNERGIRSANMLVRTLEKVLDLERNDKLKRKKAIDDFKYFDEEQRRHLAEKIERLEAERDRDLAVHGTGDAGGRGAEQPVALLDEARPAAAARAG